MANLTCSSQSKFALTDSLNFQLSKNLILHLVKKRRQFSFADKPQGIFWKVLFEECLELFILSEAKLSNLDMKIQYIFFIEIFCFTLLALTC